MQEVMKLKLVLRQAFTELREIEKGRYFKETFCSKQVGDRKRDRLGKLAILNVKTDAT
jgi:hypothetical protein